MIVGINLKKIGGILMCLSKERKEQVEEMIKEFLENHDNIKLNYPEKHNIEEVLYMFLIKIMTGCPLCDNRLYCNDWEFDISYCEEECEEECEQCNRKYCNCILDDMNKYHEGCRSCKHYLVNKNLDEICFMNINRFSEFEDIKVIIRGIVLEQGKEDKEDGR